MIWLEAARSAAGLRAASSALGRVCSADAWPSSLSLDPSTGGIMPRPAAVPADLVISGPARPLSGGREPADDEETAGGAAAAGPVNGLVSARAASDTDAVLVAPLVPDGASVGLPTSAEARDGTAGALTASPGAALGVAAPVPGRSVTVLWAPS